MAVAAAALLESSAAVGVVAGMVENSAVGAVLVVAVAAVGVVAPMAYSVSAVAAVEVATVEDTTAVPLGPGAVAAEADVVAKLRAHMTDFDTAFAAVAAPSAVAVAGAAE